MTTAIIACVQCGAETPHTWHPARGQWICGGCGLARWPAEPVAAEEPHPIVGLWRAMSGTAVEAAAQGKDDPKPTGKGGDA